MEQLSGLTHAVLSDIIASSPSGTFLLNGNLECEYSNLKFQQIAGLNQEQVSGTGWLAYLHMDDRMQLSDIMYIAQRPVVKEVRFKKPGKQLIWAKITITMIKNDLYCCTAEDITEQKRVQKQFRSLQSLIEGTNASILSFDSDFNYTTFNNAHKIHVKAARGFDIKLGDNYLEMARANSGVDAEKTERIFQQVMAGETVETIEQFGEPDMFRTWFSMICNPLFDENGKINGIGVFCQDITERVLMREESDRLHKENAEKTRLLDSIVNSASGSIFAIDLNWDYIFFNKAYRDIVKKSRGHDLKQGDNYMDIKLARSGIDMEKTTNTLKRVLAGEKLSITLELGEPDLYRAFYDINYDTLRDADGNVSGLVISSYDISERLKLQKENEEKTRLLNSIVNSTSGPIFAIDLDFNYIFFNNAHREVVKKSRGHSLKIGDNYLDITAEKSGIDVKQALTTFKRVIEDGKFHTILEFGEPGLFRAFYEINYDTLRDVNGNVAGVVVFSLDITERLKLQKEIDAKAKQRTEELESWNNFNNMLLSVLAHDLRQPFSAIIMTSDLLKHKRLALTEDELSMILMDLNDTAAKSIEFLQGLLYWVRSKKEGFEYKSVPLLLHDTVLEANSLFLYEQQNKNIALNNEVPENTLIYAHHQMLLFIFRNLISNATKYSSNNSEIRVYIYLLNDDIIVAFEDKGKGISKENISKLFNIKGNISMDGTPVKGAGIALNIAFDMVKQMHGKLWVESEVTKGATFYLSLPKKRAAL